VEDTTGEDDRLKPRFEAPKGEETGYGAREVGWLEGAVGKPTPD